MNHKEGYCAMFYHCKDCGFVTTFWNSRDGVTPFGCTCVSEGCEGDMMHDWFGSDTPCSTIPPKASHVWIDMTMEKAKEYANKFWERNGEVLMKNYNHLREMGKERLIQSKIEEIYHEGKAPDLITRNEWLNSLK